MLSRPYRTSECRKKPVTLQANSEYRKRIIGHQKEKKCMFFSGSGLDHVAADQLS